jgi:chromosome segregation ATPase
VQEKSGGIVRYILLAVAVIYAAGSLYLIYDLRNRMESMEGREKATETAQKEVQQKVRATSEGVQALNSKVGMTQDELSKRTAELRRQQQSGFRELTEEQKKQQQVVSAVSGDVATVKVDVGGAKTDIAATKADLEATKAKLEKAVGDLGMQSGLIAKNHDELEFLKHRGDRNYVEFTLKKKGRQPVGTISLELKKTDPKKSKFTLNVMADDKTIEKKDRNANEPLQFYTSPGGNRQLYELVIFTVAKDSVSGYLSSPKM